MIHLFEFQSSVVTDVFQANAKHLHSIYTMLDQRRRRWAEVVQMLCKCFVFAGLTISYLPSPPIPETKMYCIGPTQLELCTYNLLVRFQDPR